MAKDQITKELTGHKIGEHIEGCAAVEYVKNGKWDSCWVVPEYGYIKSNVIGKRGRPTRIAVLMFSCNDPDCDCKLAVEIDKLSSILEPKL